MASSVGITDTFNQPLVDAWWTPGWTAQNQSYLAVPPNQFSEQGFPPGMVYVSVIGNYFDLNGNFASGYLTFWPSSALTISTSGGTAILEQRLAGSNENILGMNQLGNGKIYLWNGQLQVALLATDQPNVTSMIPSNFTYHVLENFPLGGREFDITVPSADASNNNTGTDINSLIVPGSIVGQTLPNQSIAAVSTDFVIANLTELVGMVSGNPTSYPVQFAFVSTNTEPTSGQWHNGSWATSSAPYIAQILIGPSNSGIVLAKGIYGIWVQIVTASTVPAIEIGTLTIT